MKKVLLIIAVLAAFIMQPVYKDFIVDGVDIYDEEGEIRDGEEILNELKEIIYNQIIVPINLAAA